MSATERQRREHEAALASDQHDEAPLPGLRTSALAWGFWPPSPIPAGWVKWPGRHTQHATPIDRAPLHAVASRQLRLTKFIAGVACVLPTLACAQQAVVTDEDLARVRREQPTISEDDIAKARQRYTQLPGLEPPSSNPARAPNLNALPVPLAREPVDLAAIADGYQQQVEAAAAGLDNGPALYLFVSLSMPEPALRRLIAQAAQARATVLVRGLSDGSLRKTAARLQALIGQQQVALQIDPRPFDQFDIQRVPAFVLARTALPAECASNACRNDAAFVRTSGDVSLDYALAYIQRTAPAWTDEADRYLQRLQRRETP